MCNNTIIDPDQSDSNNYNNYFVSQVAYEPTDTCSSWKTNNEIEVSFAYVCVDRDIIELTVWEGPSCDSNLYINEVILTIYDGSIDNQWWYGVDCNNIAQNRRRSRSLLQEDGGEDGGEYDDSDPFSSTDISWQFETSDFMFDTSTSEAPDDEYMAGTINNDCQVVVRRWFHEDFIDVPAEPTIHSKIIKKHSKYGVNGNADDTNDIDNDIDNDNIESINNIESSSIFSGINGINSLIDIGDSLSFSGIYFYILCL